MAVSVQRRSFTSVEFWRMVETGIIREDERVELLDGAIVAMSPIGPRHAWCVKRLVRIFAVLGDRVVLSVQDPVHLGARSDPQPDLALLRPGTSQREHPGAADVLLVIEVGSSSIADDRALKAPLYARARIAELWLVDLVAERVEVHREPGPGGYRLVRSFGRGERISPLLAPELAIGVDAILGPAGEP